MLTLILGVPDKRACEGARSFEKVMETGVGVGYGLSPEQLDTLEHALKHGSDVEVLVIRKDRKKRRARGGLVKLEATGRWAACRQRYDVYIDFGSLEPLPYEPGPRLDHWAVKVVSGRESI